MFLNGTTALHPSPARHTALVGDWRSAVMAHRHIMGASGSGKSTLMKQWILDAINDNEAVCYIDPHVHDTDDLLQYIPSKRRHHTVVFDPTRYSIPWNPLQTDNVPLTASIMAEAIKIAWGYGEASTPRMDGMIFNSLFALMEADQGLFGLYLLLTSQSYRTEVMAKIKDPVIKHFWHWFDGLPRKEQYQQTESTINKVQLLMADPRIRAIAGQRTSFSLTDQVRDGILFIRLPQGELGVQKSGLIGSLLLTQLHQVALGRDTTVPFGLYIDEVHNFADVSIREMLSGIRKTNTMLTVCHQYSAQVSSALWSSIRANCESYAFRTSFADRLSFPELRPQEIQPHELLLYKYWQFSDSRPTLKGTNPLTHTPFPASARQIDANHRRNLHAPATNEINQLIEKFS